MSWFWNMFKTGGSFRGSSLGSLTRLVGGSLEDSGSNFFRSLIGLLPALINRISA